MSRTTAANVTVNQKTGDLHATGGVVSTYLPAAKGDTVEPRLGHSPHLRGLAFRHDQHQPRRRHLPGHARLWQGDSVLDSDQIEVWRTTRKLQATGHVVAVFPQLRGRCRNAYDSRQQTMHPRARQQRPHALEDHRAALTYWSDQGKAHLEGGVSAIQPGLARIAHAGRVPRSPAGHAATAVSPPAGGCPCGALGAASSTASLAQGDVVVRQGDRRGMADQAEYTAADGKFVLSGGQPTLADAASDTTTGHSLTFFVANDTILIDSQEGSRTLTKHRVEK